MNVQPEPITEPDQPPEKPQAQEIMEETQPDQSFFFPDLLGDGRSVSVTAPDREAAERRAKEQLTQETAQSS